MRDQPNQATQVAVRLPQKLLDEIDRLVPSRYFTRADAIRDALERLLDEVRRDEQERRYVEGYRRIPVSEIELRWVDASAREMLLEESW